MSVITVRELLITLSQLTFGSRHGLFSWAAIARSKGISIAHGEAGPTEDTIGACNSAVRVHEAVAVPDIAGRRSIGVELRGRVTRAGRLLAERVGVALGDVAASTAGLAGGLVAVQAEALVACQVGAFAVEAVEVARGGQGIHVVVDTVLDDVLALDDAILAQRRGTGQRTEAMEAQCKERSTRESTHSGGW